VSDWKFNDPRNLAVFVTEDLLTGDEPVAYVSHYVAYGAWQFHSSASDAELECVPLERVVARHPSLNQVADLPLGWSASRESPEQAWQRSPMVPIVWDELIVEANRFVLQRQQELRERFRVEEWERYDYDQLKARFVFSSKGVSKVEADILIVGSISTKTDTWLWSWANESIFENARHGIDFIEQFGRENSLRRLIAPYWPAGEVDGWEMTSITCFLTGGDGVYRAPDENGFLFMVLQRPHWTAN
jgi:Family of unknown function (DUF6882)